VKLLTWNIQAAIGVNRYRDYVLKAHLQVLDAKSKTENLRKIAREIAPYDVVCLQEVDLGGWRAGRLCQVSEIARLSHHKHIAIQENRRISGISRHGNAILSHWPLTNIRDIKLPGRIAGRGCLIADIDGRYALTVACLHLSLGKEDQKLQLERIAGALLGVEAWAAMGDFNCGARSAHLEGFCKASGGSLSHSAPLTFPSWRPQKDLDHIILGGNLRSTHYQSAPLLYSDHRPLACGVRHEKTSYHTLSPY
jgi:endonuclease/exonuclease/phosphatase family metal-dependent hydrolase